MVVTSSRIGFSTNCVLMMMAGCICLGCRRGKNSAACTGWSTERGSYCWRCHNSLLRCRYSRCRFRRGVDQGVRIFLGAEYSYHLRSLAAGAIWRAAVKLRARKWEMRTCLRRWKCGIETKRSKPISPEYP